MTREDIIKLAREAGLHLATDVKWMPIIGLEYAEKFAERVAAAEREACAKVVADESGRWAIPVTVVDYKEMWAECAAAIRARGQA